MGKKITEKLIFIFILIIALTFLTTTMSFASDFNPWEYKPEDVKRGEAEAVFTMGEKVIFVLKNIAAVISVVTIAIIGLKYMFGSVDQKAEYKTTLLPWFVGAVLVGTITVLIDFIQRFALHI